MPIDPSIALQIRPPTFPSPLEQAGKAYGLLGLIQRNKLAELALREQQQTGPLRRALLQAQADAAAALPDQRRAEALRNALQTQGLLRKETAFNQLGSLLSQPGTYMPGQDEQALEAVKQAEARGEPMTTRVLPQSVVSGLAMQAGIPLNQLQSGQRGMVVGPGAGYIPPGGSQPAFTMPFAPRAAEPLEKVQTAEGPRFLPRSTAAGQPPVLPPSATRDPKAQAEYTAGLRQLQRDEQAIAQVNQLENSLKRWRELNANVTTGRVVGYRPELMQPQLQELSQLQNSLAINNFKPGQGQISNYERQLIRGAGPTIYNDRETNERIVDIQLGAVQNARDRAAFREMFLEKNGKLLGADKAWNDYIEKNPRYIKGKEGKIVPNEQRKSWIDYFGVSGAAPTQNQTPTPQSILDQADAILNKGR